MKTEITRTIIKYASEDWVSLADTDIVIVGAGPSGLTAAKYLAENNIKVVVLERRLSFGGGIGGGGMLFHRIVVDREVESILNDFKIKFVDAGNGLLVVDSTELMAKLAVAL